MCKNVDSLHMPSHGTIPWCLQEPTCDTETRPSSPLCFQGPKVMLPVNSLPQCSQKRDEESQHTAFPQCFQQDAGPAHTTLPSVPLQYFQGQAAEAPSPIPRCFQACSVGQCTRWDDMPAAPNFIANLLTQKENARKNTSSPMSFKQTIDEQFEKRYRPLCPPVPQHDIVSELKHVETPIDGIYLIV